MRELLGSYATFLALSTASADPPPREPLQAAAADLKPVMVAVIDSDSGEPVRSFTYQAWYDAPGRQSAPNNDEWKRVASPSGTFELQAPPACRLRIIAEAPDYIGGYPLVNEFVIKPANDPRRVVVRLRRGITVKGTVRDSKTKKPIAGAMVAPLVHKPPGWHPDEDKQVKTGADGRYEVRGVDPAAGVAASHPDYVGDRKRSEGKTTGPIHDIFLKRGVNIPVTAVDTAGKPLEGVKVFGLNEELVASDKDGRLVVAAEPETRFSLLFFKDGFIHRFLRFEEIDRELAQSGRLVVVMEPLIALKGRVVAPDGRPVAAFTVAAGPGKLPSRLDSVERDVQGRDGLFSLGLSTEGTTWVGVAAHGFAAWEGWVEVKRGGKPLKVHLSPGVTVSGRIVAPEALRNRVEAKLVPRLVTSDGGSLPSDSPAAELATRTASFSADGRLRFQHVRPDRYRLIIEGRGVPKTALALDVPDAGLDVESVRFDVPTATGRVEGRIWRPKEKGGGPWAFAKGSIGGFCWEGLGGDDGGIEFQADENGRFKVDRVPVGLTTIEFPYIVFDQIMSYTWKALVVEGQTTLLRAFDPEGRRDFTVAFAIGDGSKAQYESGTGLSAARKVDNVTVSSQMLSLFRKTPATPRTPMFRVELVPQSKGPLSFVEPDWKEIDSERKVMLPGVGPGTYRLRIYDWLGMVGLDSGPLFEQAVIVPPEGRREVRVALGAGCITGKIPASGNFLARRVEVSALAKVSRTPSRRTRCDGEGNFCVRYLSPGTYSVFIHDPEQGFCRVDDVRVGAGVVDVGERTLASGAKISGAIHFVRPSRVPDEIVAFHPTGISVRQTLPVYSSFDHVELAGLWPGHWSVSARSGDVVLATSELDVEGTGTFRVTLTAGGGPNP